MSSLARYLGSLLFTAYLFLSVFVFGLAALPSGLLPGWQSYRVAVAWAGSVLCLLEILCRLDYVVEGAEHLDTGNCVVLLKHSSSWETIALFKIFPRQTWVMKRELLWAPILGYACYGPSRSTARRAAQPSSKWLRRGANVLSRATGS